MRPLHGLAACALCILASSIARAQEPLEPAEATTVLHATSNLVLIDVVVTDKDQAVHGLERKRFHVFEDGREQAIASFDENRAPGTLSAASRPAMKTTVLPPETYTNIPDYPDTGAVNILLLDGLNTPLNDQMIVRQKMMQYIAGIKPGTSLAIFALSSQLRMITGFSTDLAALTSLLKSSKAAAMHSTLIDPDNIVQDVGVTTSTQTGVNANPANVANELGSAGASANGGPIDAAAAVREFQSETASGLIDQRVLITIDALQQLARYLSAIPGRKNVLWFSGSFPSWIAPDESLGMQAYRAAGSHADELRETARRLSDARISIYPIDARGLENSPLFSAAYHSPIGNPLAGDNSFATQLHSETERRVAEQGSMQKIAQDTGGKAFVDTNDFKEAVAEAIENGSSYYTIGYVPQRKRFDGQFHAFKVSLDGATYKLAYRNGYFADDPDRPSPYHPGESNLLMDAAGHGAPVATQIAFVARVLPASDPHFQGVALSKGPVGNLAATMKAPLRRYVVDLVLDLHGMAFDSLPDGSRQAAIEYALVAYDEEGTRLNYLQHAVHLTLSSSRFPKLMAAGVPLRAELDLPDGQDWLRIAIHDLDSGRVGSLELPLAVAVP